MDKLSGFIPLLIMIVAGIISVRKVKQTVKESTSPKEAFPTIPQLTLMQEKPSPEKKIVTPVAPKISTPGKQQSITDEQSIEIQDIDESDGFNIDFSDPEEVKRAIIYSEIFNKKDF